MSRQPKAKKSNCEVASGAGIHPALRAYFGYCLYKAAFRHRADLEKCFSQYGIVPPQFGIINVLIANGPLNQMTLGEEMGIDKATMVKLIDGLEEQKYVERVASKEDRRAKFIRVTAKGKALLPKLIREGKKVEEQFLSPLTANEIKVLKEVLPKLVR